MREHLGNEHGPVTQKLWVLSWLLGNLTLLLSWMTTEAAGRVEELSARSDRPRVAMVLFYLSLARPGAKSTRPWL